MRWVGTRGVLRSAERFKLGLATIDLGPATIDLGPATIDLGLVVRDLNCLGT